MSDIQTIKKNLKALDKQELLTVMNAVFIVLIIPTLFGIVLGLVIGFLIWR